MPQRRLLAGAPGDPGPPGAAAAHTHSSASSAVTVTPLLAISPLAVSTVTRYVGGSPKSFTTEYSVVPPHPNVAAVIEAPVWFGEPLSRGPRVIAPDAGLTDQR